MPGIGRVGDFAGGQIMVGCMSVSANDLPVSRIGSQISSHGRNEHEYAQMTNGFSGVTVEDIPVCITGNVASCGHVLISNSDVEVG